MLIRIRRAEAQARAKTGCFVAEAIGIRFALVIVPLVRENSAGTVPSHV